MRFFLAVTTALFAIPVIAAAAPSYEPNWEVSYEWDRVSIEDNGRYVLPIGSERAAFYNWIGRGVVYGLVYKGTLNHAERINGHFLGGIGPKLEVDVWSEYGPYFVAIIDIEGVPDASLFDPWFQFGADEAHPDAIPPDRWGIVRFEVVPSLVEGFSNVAFLPGLQASRLYRLEGAENQLWEPNRNADVEQLFLDSDGNPVNPGIYTRDIIDETNVIPPDLLFGQNIYKSFISFMDGLVADHTINEWRALPYDWRMGVSDIVTNGVTLPDNGHYDLIGAIEELAASSATGEVTLVAHSNGGLVAKALLTELLEHGKGDLVDKLILVGTPQLGTPKAIAGMLHGDEQDIPRKLGFILNKETAREFSERMPGAYSLLPSGKYFDTVIDPVIEFDPSATLLQGLRNLYGFAVNTIGELRAFLLGDNGARPEPVPADTNTPNVLRGQLLSEASTTKDMLDDWVPSLGLKVYQIAGWGLDTIRGIRYTERMKFQCNADRSVCGDAPVLDREPLFTTDGDKTVVIPSAVGMDEAVGTYYLNLKLRNRGIQNFNREHADILEVSEVRELIEKLMTEGENPILPSFIGTEKPTGVENLRLHIHSPARLDVFDSFGNHTGLSTSTIPDSDLVFVDEQIPNSSYLEFGEGKYIGVDTADDYTALLRGTDAGTFSFIVEKVIDGTASTVASYVDIPVTQNTVATLMLHANGSTTELVIDADNDGDTDAVVGMDNDIDALAYLALFRNTVERMQLKPLVKKLILLDLRAVEKDLQKQRIKQARLKIKLLETGIRFGVKKKQISVSDGEVLLDMIERLDALMLK